MTTPTPPVAGDVRAATITLTALNLRNALDFVAPDFETDEDQRETEVTICWAPDRQSIDGDHLPAGYYCWLADYPEEGCIPLDQGVWTAPAAPAGADGWISVEERLPETGVDVLVYEPTRPDDWPGSLRIFIDHISEDYEDWYSHCSAYEHFMAVGGPRAAGPDVICTGPSEKAPYTHWRPLPPAPGAAAAVPGPTDLELLQVECAGYESAAFYLGMLVDDLRPLLARAMAAMKALHEAAQPDEGGPDIDAIIPGADFRTFVDVHAALLHDVAQLPAAPGTASAPGRLHQRAGDEGGAA